MIPWGKIDHHKFTQLEHIRCGLIDMLDSLHPSVSPSLLFPFSLAPSLLFFCPSFFPLPLILPSFLLLPFFPLACLFPCLFAFWPSFKHIYYSFFPMSSSSRDISALLSIAPCLSLMFSLWSDCDAWTGTRIIFGMDKTGKKEQEILTLSWYLLNMAQKFWQLMDQWTN